MRFSRWRTSLRRLSTLRATSRSS
ncbi:unnamed protein product [Linum tenue]|uniref:Uncharacterized protein n=1 Tax=Linum tenue TaxID=586396 RepID=A0AAV0M3P1_9ROSI|nr:unnamed protein product [Linum tenue]